MVAIHINNQKAKPHELSQCFSECTKWRNSGLSRRRCPHLSLRSYGPVTLLAEVQLLSVEEGTVKLPIAHRPWRSGLCPCGRALSPPASLWCFPGEQCNVMACSLCTACSGFKSEYCAMWKRTPLLSSLGLLAGQERMGAE